jgi:hypothetical protein
LEEGPVLCALIALDKHDQKQTSGAFDASQQKIFLPKMRFLPLTGFLKKHHNEKV